MDILVLALVLIGSVWVLIDAQNIGVQKGMMPGLFDMNPAGWMFGCLLLFVVFFPVYLVKRPTYQRIARNGTFTPSAETESRSIGKTLAIVALGVFGVIGGALWFMMS